MLEGPFKGLIFLELNYSYSPGSDQSQTNFPIPNVSELHRRIYTQPDKMTEIAFLFVSLSKCT
jgi:hypothetical protein